MSDDDVATTQPLDFSSVSDDYAVEVLEALYGALNTRTLPALLQAIRMDPEWVNKLVALIALDVVGENWRYVRSETATGMAPDELDGWLREGEDAQWRRDLRAKLDQAWEAATDELRAP